MLQRKRLLDPNIMNDLMRDYEDSRQAEQKLAKMKEEDERYRREKERQRLKQFIG
jgi:hypothetical protein